MIVPPCPRCHLFHPATSPCLALALLQGDDPILPAGTVLAGHYRVLAVVHRGGMSMVYRAEDTRFPSLRIALKELRVAAEIATSHEAEAWFARECFVLSTFQHPLIPDFYGVFREGGRSYIAQEYIGGENLDDLVRGQGPVEEAQVVDWGLQLCGVLTALHEHPDGALIYRDLKPANVILRASDGRLVLVDFGSTRSLAPGEVGTVIGTPGYAAPEQYQGLADPRTDVYALGATLHRLVTGHDPERAQPFRFPPACELNPAVSPALAAVLARAVQLEPAARYATVREVHVALEALLPRAVAPAADATSPVAAPSGGSAAVKTALALVGGSGTGVALAEAMHWAAGQSHAVWLTVHAVYVAFVLAFVVLMRRRYRQ